MCSKLRIASSKTRAQRGYVLLVLLLFATALAISMLEAGRLYVGELKREREIELVHRGAQYSRAIKKYFRKFGRYPNSIDQLENSNNMRFLRRRYKDPMTGDEFRVLHFGEVKLQQKGPNATTNPGIPAENVAGQQGSSTPFRTASGAPASGQPGGGPIIGVASKSKKQSLLEFNEKDHYNEWEFVYDPSIDRGGLIKGPYNGQTLMPNAPGQPGLPGAQGMPVGGQPFGAQPGMGGQQGVGGQQGQGQPTTGPGGGFGTNPK